MTSSILDSSPSPNSISDSLLMIIIMIKRYCVDYDDEWIPLINIF